MSSWVDNFGYYIMITTKNTFFYSLFGRILILFHLIGYVIQRNRPNYQSLFGLYDLVRMLSLSIQNLNSQQLSLINTDLDLIMTEQKCSSTTFTYPIQPFKGFALEKFNFRLDLHESFRRPVINGSPRYVFGYKYKQTSVIN